VGGHRRPGRPGGSGRRTRRDEPGRAARAVREPDQDLAPGPAGPACAGRRGRDVPGPGAHLGARAGLAAEPGHGTRRRHSRDEPGRRFGREYRAAGRRAAVPDADRRHRERHQGRPPGRRRSERRRSGRRRGKRRRWRRRRSHRGGRRIRGADARVRLRRRRRVQPGQCGRGATRGHVLALPPPGPEPGEEAVTSWPPARRPGVRWSWPWPGSWRSWWERRSHRSCRCRTRRTWTRCPRCRRPLRRTRPCRRANPR
jgi:hypothetical protein